jgi:hypothetical protein
MQSDVMREKITGEEQECYFDWWIIKFKTPLLWWGF